MRDDPIVDEIRQIRRLHTDRFQGDLHAICEDLKRQERESGRRIVTYPPRPVPRPPAAQPVPGSSETDQTVQDLTSAQQPVEES